MTLDDTDQSLLSILTSEGRVKNVELARRVGLSPSTCLERVRRLERKGVIVGYRAVISRTGKGTVVEGWADIRLAHTSRDTIHEFMQLLNATPEVIEAYRTAGSYDYVLRFCAGNVDAWTSFSARLAALGCEAQARFTLLLEPLKITASIPAVGKRVR